MEVILCWLTGFLFTIGVYLILSSNMLRILFGILILSSGVNLLIFTVGRPAHILPAFIKANRLFINTANALPQALILTAIVIGFGLFTYCLILIRSVWQSMHTLNSDKLDLAECKTKDKSL